MINEKKLLIQGKSYTRRYYENIMEQFEAEAKYIRKMKEFELKEKELIEKLKVGITLGTISSEHLNKYLEKIAVLKQQVENEQKTFSKQELEMFVLNSINKKAESSLKEENEKLLDMSKSEEQKVKEIKVR